MAVTINASTSAGLVQTADTTGNLSLQSNGTTIAALTSTGLAVTGAGSFSTTLAVTGDGTVGGRFGVGAAASATYPLNLVQNDNNFIRLLAGNSRVWRIGATGANATAGTFSLIDDSAGLTRLSVDYLGAVTIPGTLGVTGTITPGQTTGIVGTTTNNSAQAGSVGEYVESTVTASTSGYTDSTVINVTSISLTAGDWDVRGLVYGANAGGTTFKWVRGSISSTSATHAAAYLVGNQTQTSTGQGDNNINPAATCPTTRISIASTTTVYLIGSLGFTGSTFGLGGIISARRVR